MRFTSMHIASTSTRRNEDQWNLRPGSSTTSKHEKRIRVQFPKGNWTRWYRLASRRLLSLVFLERQPAAVRACLQGRWVHGVAYREASDFVTPFHLSCQLGATDSR